MSEQDSLIIKEIEDMMDIFLEDMEPQAPYFCLFLAAGLRSLCFGSRPLCPSVVDCHISLLRCFVQSIQFSSRNFVQLFIDNPQII